MTAFKDINLLDGELNMAGGDFNIKDSEYQHQEDIIMEDKGSYKKYPLLGVGITRYLNSTGTQLAIQKAIKLNLEIDGYYLEKLVFDNDNETDFTVSAIRKI